MSAVATNLQDAFDQIEAFRAIHEPAGVTLDAVLCLQESVGIDDATRRLIADRLFNEGAADSRQSTATFLGLIIGLLAAQFAEGAG